MRETNVTGTRNVLDAAVAAGVGRIVYTSTVSTVHFSDDGIPADETSMAGPTDLVGPYKRTKYEAFETMAPYGIWCGPVLSPEELLTNEQLIAREMIVDVDDEGRGTYKMIGCPIKMEKSPVNVRPAPQYGQNTDEILTDILNIGPDELAAMRDRHAII